MTDTTTSADASLAALAQDWEDSQVPEGELTRPGTDPREDADEDVPQTTTVDTAEEDRA